MLTGIHHTSITVSDLERSLAFYQGILGFPVHWDSQAAGLRVEGAVAAALTQCPGTSQRLVFLEVNGKLLELVEYTPRGRASGDTLMSDVGAAHIGFSTIDIDGLYAKLVEHGVRVHCAPQEVFEMRVFYFRDPDGVGLEAMQGKLRTADD